MLFFVLLSSLPLPRFIFSLPPSFALFPCVLVVSRGLRLFVCIAPRSFPSLAFFSHFHQFLPLRFSQSPFVFATFPCSLQAAAPAPEPFSAPPPRPVERERQREREPEREREPGGGDMDEEGEGGRKGRERREDMARAREAELERARLEVSVFGHCCCIYLLRSIRLCFGLVIF